MIIPLLQAVHQVLVGNSKIIYLKFTDSVTAAMTSPAYQCYAGAHLPITGGGTPGGGAVYIRGGVNDVRELCYGELELGHEVLGS